MLLAPDVVPVGTLVDMLPGSAQRGWIDGELRETSEDGTSEGRRRQGGGGQVEEGWRKMQHRCWELQGGCCSQLACMSARERVCAHYVPMSRDFQTSVELESNPLQRKKAPPTLVPELQHG